jgi:asparagine synthase (glutamine-hydrolysing)
MCGIAAIFHYAEPGRPVDSQELDRMLEQMKRRGPDGSGTWYSENRSAALGHRRLSIIDLSESGAQPMASEDGKAVITFNGEIYNYRELRAQLETKGRRFRSQSDTEVLLQLYQEFGEAMLNKLRGMYAFAIWDARKQGLFLACDPFGIKPLYYADDGRGIRVASQVKALLTSQHVDTSPEPAGHVGFFLWGHVPDPFTLYHGIQALPAGHFLWTDERGRQERRSFCSISRIIAEAEALESPKNKQEIREQLRTAVRDSVEHHLIADVPVGIFLSAGLDSSTLAAYVSEKHSKVRTVTLGFREYQHTKDDEVPLAEQMARVCGTEHRTIWVTRADFEARQEELFAAMDRPSIDGVNTYFVSMAARQAGLKVALSGLGGDELFGGYPSFREVPLSVNALRTFGVVPGLGRNVRIVASGLLKRFTSPKYAGLLEYGTSYGGAYLLRRGLFMPWELPDVLDPELARAGWESLQTLASLNKTADGIKSPHAKVAALELCWYMRHQLLRDSDWAGMGHSVEIRVPFVDVDLLRQIAPLLGGVAAPSKLDMARSAPKQLPQKVLERRKTGFTVPVREWLMKQSSEARGRCSAPDRGLRGWARYVHGRFAGAQECLVKSPTARRASLHQAAKIGDDGRGKPARSQPVAPNKRHGENTAPYPSQACHVLVLLTDAFGGHGGIAKFNRDLLTALCSYPDVAKVVALPRIMPNPFDELPDKLEWRTEALGGKLRYLRELVRQSKRLPTLDSPVQESTGRSISNLRSRSSTLLVCAHINLLPFAAVASRILKTPPVLIIHGIDAWQPTARAITNRFARQVLRFIAVSRVTRTRFCNWTGLAMEKGFILPNCVERSRFSPGCKKPELLKRYGLEAKKVLMTFGRLASEERYKGFDEVLEVLPKLALEIPELCYLICGDGPDRTRLEQKAKELEISERVIFSGFVPETEKADHYRLADAYIMPSRGEGFGIVFLEAMACGIPVLGSKVDGSSEALRQGELGVLVDPDNRAELIQGIVTTLKQPKGFVPAGLNYFSYDQFEQRCHTIVDRLLDAKEQADSSTP